MKSLFLVLCMFCVAPLCAADLTWQTDYAATLAQAEKEGKPVLIDFTAAWCTWCRFMDRTTFQDETVKNSLSRYLLVRVDFDKATDLVARFGVKGIPALFVLNRFGETVSSQSGYADPRAFYDWITRNDSAAQTTRSARQEEAEKLHDLISQIGQGEPAKQTERTDQIIAAALVASTESSKTALSVLQSMIEKSPVAFLQKLNDQRLAVRILFASLYAEKLGADFHFDPWETTEARADIVATWTGKLNVPIAR